MRNPLRAALAAAVLMAVAAPLGAHCQVPCGIYDDAARIARIREDIETIDKAVRNIRELAGKDDPQSANQLVRWTMTKEEHASNIIEIVSTYFLAQRVKPVAGAEGKGVREYQRALADHHGVMVAAMKAKQSADPAAVAALREAVDRLAVRYVREHE
jgi:nickel superoxide dismutase